MNEYLSWMAANTPTQWCNDSALSTDIERAMASGAVGVTTNAPLSYEALTVERARFAAAVAGIPVKLSGADRVVELLRVVVSSIAGRLRPVYESTKGRYGYVRSQVQPAISGDYDAQLAQGLAIATFAPNVKVKVPGTESGIQVLEELAARGIPTNPTVCVSLPQIIVAAGAYERGARRAEAAGITPAPSSAALVMGRLQDWLTAANAERALGLAPEDLELACLAVVKRTYGLLRAAGGRTVLMPAAFRSARQVAELAGADVEATIHPKIQKAVADAYAAGEFGREVRIDAPVDEAAVQRVAEAIPEFVLAYTPNGMVPAEFDTFGPTVATLKGFHETGWAPLGTL